MTLGSAFLFERILHVFLKWFKEDKDILMVRPPGLDPPLQYIDIHSFMSIFPLVDRLQWKIPNTV